jgi:hypothetical protein
MLVSYEDWQSPELANVQADYGLLVGIVEIGHAIGTVKVDAWEANRRARTGGRDHK